MANQQNSYTGSQGTGTNNADFSFTFPSFTTSEVKVEVDNVVKTLTTHYTVENYNTTSGGTVRFTTNNIPTGTTPVRIFRQTDVDASKATFTAGSSLKAGELNANFKQVRHALQEAIGANATDRKVQEFNIEDDAITTAKIKDDNVTLAKLGGGALPTDITVASANIVDGTVVNADINNSAAIAGTKISPDFGSQNIATTGTVDGRDVSADGTKLDTIETNAKDDQTAAEIRTLVESATDSNVFTDADHSKLNAIEAGATADQTNAEIRAAVEAASDSNVFTDADHTKLNAIEAGATADQTNAEIKTAYEANADTNEYSDAEQSKLAGIETSATADQTASEIKTLLQSDKLTLSEMNTTSLDGRYFTETELTGGALDGRYYTETEAEAKFLRQDSSETIASGVTWSSTDSKVATTAAIDARVIDLVDDVGGFVPIANETSFPNANPDVNNGAGTLVSIKALTNNIVSNGSGVATISNGTVGNSTVTINGLANSTTYAATFGMIVETTTTLNTYTFHRLVPKATEVTTVAANATNIAAAGANITSIDTFANRYQVNASAPTARSNSSSLVNGDLWFDSSSNKVMMVYDGSSGDGFSPITPNQATLTNINIVAGQVTYTEDLGNITDAVNTGSGNNSVNTVGANISSVQTAATNIAKINTVADDLNEGTSEIDTVATNITNVNNVGNNISNVNAVHNNASNINAAVSNASNINSAVSNASNINTVAGNNTNINTVAGANSNITTVAGSISNVNTAATNIASINTTAASIANVNNFTDRYQVASSNPSTDGGGNSLAAGDLYFNTSANELKVYTGSQWQGGVTATGNFASITGNTFTGDNLYNDNIKAKFGNSSDLEIFHNSSTGHSVIKETGGGVLSLQTNGNSIDLTDINNSIVMGQFTKDGACTFKHGATTRLATTSTGATVTGLLTATTIDGSAGNNLTLDFGTL